MLLTGSQGRRETLYISEIAADRVAHVVFMRLCAPEAGEKIRNYLFSDLSRK
uniref:hypothetical protein n=1 Tax=Salmonella enterica TaxID=28901 RepID=UPI003839F729